LCNLCTVIIRTVLATSLWDALSVDTY